MYFVIIDEKNDNPVNDLVDEVIKAHQRGVRVKVVLEDGKFKENVQAYNKLRNSGVDVRFDTPVNLLHIKAVVIDGRYVFCGSTNWSKAAILQNYEVTSFYESVPDAVSLNISDWGGERLKEDVRWKFGVPPTGNANYAWIQHFIHHLSPNGIAGFVLANGSMSSNTSGEGEIRKNVL